MVKEILLAIIFSCVRLAWIAFFLYSLNLFFFSLWAYGVSYDDNFFRKTLAAGFMLISSIVIFIKYKHFFLKKNPSSMNGKI
jgi:hypothetical protein